MADPETAAETGPAETETVAETVETETEVETAADDSAGDHGDDDAEGEPDQQGKASIPYARFKDVNGKRKAAEAKAIELQAKLDALTPKKEEKAVEPKARLRGLKQAPADWTPMEQMEHYIMAAVEAHPEIIEGILEKKFGMSVDAAAATLAQARPRVQRDIRTEFETACKAHGLDPNDKLVQHMVGTAMDGGLARTFDEAMDAFVKPKGNGKTTTTERRRVNGAETDSVDVSGLTRVNKTFLSKDEATALAAQGKRVVQKSVVELLKESSKAQ